MREAQLARFSGVARRIVEDERRCHKCRRRKPVTTVENGGRYWNRTSAPLLVSGILENRQVQTKSYNIARPNEIAQETAEQSKTGLDSFGPTSGPCCGPRCVKTSRDVEYVTEIIQRRWSGMSKRRQDAILKLLGERYL